MTILLGNNKATLNNVTATENPSLIKSLVWHLNNEGASNGQGITSFLSAHNGGANVVNKFGLTADPMVSSTATFQNTTDHSGNYHWVTYGSSATQRTQGYKVDFPNPVKKIEAFMSIKPSGGNAGSSMRVGLTSVSTGNSIFVLLREGGGYSAVGYIDVYLDGSIVYSQYLGSGSIYYSYIASIERVNGGYDVFIDNNLLVHVPTADNSRERGYIYSEREALAGNGLTRPAFNDWKVWA